jgi:anion-transporting  ArsA/GET3 family ATPase
MSDALNRRFVIVAGKGGVGRTTVSAALGLAAVRQGKTVLIAMCHVKEQLSAMLGVPAIGMSVKTVLPGLDAVNMFPETALKEYGQLKLKIPMLYRAVFENKTVMAFLRATPGIDAWSMLGKACYHAMQTTRAHGPRYDLVILDAPATGHCLDMLRVPRVITEIAPAGLLRKDAEAAWQLLQDPSRTTAVVVSWPEEMPINEAIELQRTLREELQIDVSELIVNGVMAELFQAQERVSFSQVAQQAVASSAWCLFQSAHRRGLRETEQAELLKTLQASVSVPISHLPRLASSVLGPTDIKMLSTCFNQNTMANR